MLDGHLHALARKALGLGVTPWLMPRNDESYSYNHRVNLLSTILGKMLIQRAIDRGVGIERSALALNVNFNSINHRLNLLDGIVPHAIALLQDQQFTPDVTHACQIESVELMVVRRTISVVHAEALLRAAQ